LGSARPVLHERVAGVEDIHGEIGGGRVLGEDPPVARPIDVGGPAPDSGRTSHTRGTDIR
jgi:hypothetical protein